MTRRVVITGLGIVSPIGIGIEQAWEAALNAKSGISKIRLFDPTDFKSQIAGQIPEDYDPTNYIPAKLAKRLDRFCHYALGAAKMALDDSGMEIDDRNAERIGVIVGCGLGGMSTIEAQHNILLERGPGRVSPFFIPMVCPNMAAGQIAIQFGPKGPNTCVSTACAAGNHAIGNAFHLIKHGISDAAFAGGVEAVIDPSAVAGFASMKALSTRNDDPEHASRPFDADRDGFVIAEGSGILILEELECAKARGAKIYAEMVGFGMTADAHHMTAPPPDGNGAVRCMKMALNEAKLNTGDVDYINAHGTSTPLNDDAESKAIKSAFGDDAYKVAISSTKSMTGHLLGGAGGVEGVFLAKTVSEDKVPPTANLENPDSGCDLDYVPKIARDMKVNVAMSNAFGFGGTNATVIFRKFEG